MNQKIELIIKSTENRIKKEQEKIDRCLADIQEQAASYEAYNIVTFLPNKIDQLKEAMELHRALSEQLQMLKFIQQED